MSYDLRVFCPKISVDNCVEVYRQLGPVESTKDEWKLTVADSAVWGGLKPFVAEPYSDQVLPCLTVAANSGCPVKAGWAKFIIPYLCLVEWDGAVAVDPQAELHFDDPERYLSHISGVLPSRYRARELRHEGLLRDDGTIVTPYDPDYQRQSR